MPQILLKKMLSSLMESGCAFCHPEGPSSGAVSRFLHASPASGSGGDFSAWTPGGEEFLSSPGGDHAYYPPEKHPSHVEIILPLSGEAEFFLHGSWKTLKNGQVYVLLRNTVHTERHGRSEAYRILWLTVLPEGLTLHRTGYTAESGYVQSACRVWISPPESRQLWECGNESPVDESHYFSLLVRCLDFAVQQHLAENRSRAYPDAVLEQIHSFLEKNCTQSVSLNDLAGMAHYSPMHLNRLFLKRYGMTLHQFLLKKRISEARNCLKQGMRPGEAALCSGFPDPRYFSRVFRSVTGQTPTEFRNSMRGQVP